MAEAHHDLTALPGQAAAEEAFPDGGHQAEDARRRGVATPLASSPAVSLMITNQQRAALREVGFSDEAVRLMTPAEAHEHLGLTKPDHKDESSASRR